mgnify:CR=1 FL=1
MAEDVSHKLAEFGQSIWLDNIKKQGQTSKLQSNLSGN